MGKPGGTGLPTEWATRHGADRDRLISAGRQLGWSENWVRQVSLLAASTLCLHAGVPLDGLRDEHFTDLLAELDRAGCVSVSARRKVRTRLFALRQACYQLGVLAQPPRKGGPVAGTPAEHARAVRQPEVRPEVVRYVTTISTTLRPTTVAGRTKALLAFFNYLADQHPQVRRLDQLERTTHIEPYLAWVRYRPWRGANGRGRTVSLSVVHQDVVDVRCFFDDIACWG